MHALLCPCGGNFATALLSPNISCLLTAYSHLKRRFFAHLASSVWQCCSRACRPIICLAYLWLFKCSVELSRKANFDGSTPDEMHFWCSYHHWLLNVELIVRVSRCVSFRDAPEFFNHANLNHVFSHNNLYATSESVPLVRNFEDNSETLWESQEFFLFSYIIVCWSFSDPTSSHISISTFMKWVETLRYQHYLTLSFQGNYFLTWAFLVADPARLVDSGIETVREEVL